MVYENLFPYASMHGLSVWLVRPAAAAAVMWALCTDACTTHFHYTACSSCYAQLSHHICYCSVWKEQNALII